MNRNQIFFTFVQLARRVVLAVVSLITMMADKIMHTPSITGRFFVLFTLLKRILTKNMVKKFFSLFPLISIIMIIASVGFTSNSLAFDFSSYNQTMNNNFDLSGLVVSNVSSSPQSNITDFTGQGTYENSTIKHNEDIQIYGEEYPEELSGIKWGTIQVRIPKNYTISIFNAGSKPNILELSTDNWTTGVVAQLTWDYNGKEINVNTSISVTLTLLIESANVTSFSNDIIITATDI